MPTTHQHDIAIIGAGPAGLSFATTVAPSSKSIAIIDKAPEGAIAQPSYDGREIALTHPSRDIMRELGMWAHLPESEIYPLKEAKVLNGQSDYSLHFPVPSQSKSQLGFLVSNHHIRHAAYQAAKNYSNLHFYTSNGVTDLVNGTQQGTLSLENGDTIQAQLIIAADSRFSPTRTLAGIATDRHEYRQTVLVIRAQHEKSHHNTAYECFTYGKTLAILPLGENESNLVITLDNNQLTAFSERSNEDIAAELSQDLAHLIGKITLTGTWHRYPLITTHARRFYAQRYALIGDAAVGMHPVTAHGFNLGLQSAYLLGNLINKAANQGQDIASNDLLAAYENQHMPHTKILYYGTHLMVNLYTNETPAGKFMRQTLLHLSNNLPPLKKAITKQLTG